MTFTGRGLYASSSKVPRKRRSGWLFIGVAVAVAVLVIGAVRALGEVPTGKESRSDTFGGAARVVVDNDTGGDVEVRSSGGDEVTVARTLRGSPLGEPGDEVELDGETVRADADCNGLLPAVGGCAVDYEISVPAGTELTIETTSGEVELTSIEGDVQVDTDSGQVTADELKGNAAVSTSSGGIELSDVAGDMELKTTSGGITASGTAETVQAESTSGTVHLEEISAVRVEAGSVSGTVNIEGDFETADVETVSGTVNVDAESPFERVTAESTSGSVQMRVPRGDYRVTGESTSGERDIEVGRDSSASAEIEASTTSGSIDIGYLD
ncbi:MAG: DUF4097 family beta strand repeat-containing protein [Nocardiopsaceae bacterium]|nr:DUF4097 family beta strand repeat-containing protein [Nocardiopsaceae bacterium]